jgi:hypothetical protein
MTKPSVRKWLLVSIGVLSVGLAIVGVFVPLLPTTPFLLLAATCFVRSSDRLYKWLVTHRWLGPYIRNYREHKAITRKTKIATLALLWGTIGYTAFGVMTSWPLRVLLLLVAVGVTVHVLSMKTLTGERLSRPSGVVNECGENGYGPRSPGSFRRFRKGKAVSKCRVRLILWLLLAVTSVGGGIIADLALGTGAFPLWIRLLGLVGMILAHFPLKRTGELLSRMGEAEEWGCTTRLVTTDIYRCVRHPHHVGVGIFMTSLGLLIGHRWSFLIISISQWAWVLGFLLLVEERELVEKFGGEYEVYRRQVPMLLPNPVCAIRVLSSPIDTSR